MNREISGDILKTVREILMERNICAGEASAEANLIVTEVSGFRIEEILAGKEISEDAKAKIFDIARRRAETKEPNFMWMKTF